MGSNLVLEGAGLSVARRAAFPGRHDNGRIVAHGVDCGEVKIAPGGVTGRAAPYAGPRKPHGGPANV